MMRGVVVVIAACGSPAGSPPSADAGEAELVSDRMQLDFGTNVSGSASSATIAFTNTGSVPSESLLATTTNTAAFMVTVSRCVDPLAAGATCSVDVQFRAIGLGTSNGTLAIGGDVVALSGDSIFSPGPAVAPPLHDFGALAVGTTMTTTITVSATGASEGPIAVSLTGDDFSLAADACSGMTLGPACTVDVAFAPTVARARAAELDVDIPSPGRPIHASLIGAGR